jgi:hypothetical protein
VLLLSTMGRGRCVEGHVATLIRTYLDAGRLSCSTGSPRLRPNESRASSAELNGSSREPQQDSFDTSFDLARSFSTLIERLFMNTNKGDAVDRPNSLLPTGGQCSSRDDASPPSILQDHSNQLLLSSLYMRLLDILHSQPE